MFKEPGNDSISNLLMAASEFANNTLRGEHREQGRHSEQLRPVICILW